MNAQRNMNMSTKALKISGSSLMMAPIEENLADE